MRSSRTRKPANTNLSNSFLVGRLKSVRKHLTFSYDLFLIGVLLVLGGYAVALAFQVAKGYSATLPTPQWRVRLQVINGTGDKNILSRALNEISECKDDRMKVEIVETSSFRNTDLPQTFVVSREKDLKAAQQLATRLGLDPDYVTYEPLEHNREHITATLILGTESDQWLAARKSTQEVATRN